MKNGFFFLMSLSYGGIFVNLITWIFVLAHGAAYREKKIKKKKPIPQPSAAGLANYVSVVVVVIWERRELWVREENREETSEIEWEERREVWVREEKRERTPELRVKK